MNITSRIALGCLLSIQCALIAGLQYNQSQGNVEMLGFSKKLIQNNIDQSKTSNPGNFKTQGENLNKEIVVSLAKAQKHSNMFEVLSYVLMLNIITTAFVIGQQKSSK